jgi:hypothetical protein
VRHGHRTHLAWYVGDRAGAIARLDAVVTHLRAARVTAVTMGPAVDLAERYEVVELPWPSSADGSGVLDEQTVAELGAWIAADRPDLFVVDGRDELAEVARLAGVAAVTVRRPADRVVASSSALGSEGALAPYPRTLGSAPPRPLRETTAYPGLVSRYAGRRADRRAGRRALGLPADAPVVTVVCGRDGLGPDVDVAAAAAATSDWTWVVVGRCGGAADPAPANLHRLGWTDDPWPALEAADVVVTGAALSTIAEVASAGRPLVTVPRRDRSGDEVLVSRLTAIGAAVPLHRWPEGGAWPGLLEAAEALGGAALARLEDGSGPARAAGWLEELLRGDVRAAGPDLTRRWRATSHPARRPVTPAEVVDLARWSPVAARAGDR